MKKQKNHLQAILQPWQYEHLKVALGEAELEKLSLRVEQGIKESNARYTTQPL
jgi:hypothetical protein